MAKVPYSKLNLKVNTEVNTFEFNNLKIDVLKYLPIKDKYDLITIALQNSEHDDVYNDLELDMYFHLYLVYMYTNLSFTDKQREDEAKLYDSLKSSGFLDEFLKHINEEEYNELYEMLVNVKDANSYYKTTAAAMVKSFIVDMPKNAEAAAAVLKDFNPNQFTELIQFANNMGKRN